MEQRYDITKVKKKASATDVSVIFSAVISQNVCTPEAYQLRNIYIYVHIYLRQKLFQYNSHRPPVLPNI